AATLRQLRHFQIPRFVDDFVAGQGKATSLVLVQEFVDGENLAEEMAARRYTEIEVVDLLIEMLGILRYLHGLSPPVVHRDIKPSNVMRRRGDGRLVLVDFGSVKSVLADEVIGGSTVAGTFGFMAPEQFHGKASPASDLYSLAMMALVLLSRRDPADLVDAEHRLDWKRHVRLHRDTEALLDRWLQADPARRADQAGAEEQRARALLETLRADARPSPRGSGPVRVVPPSLAPLAPIPIDAPTSEAARVLPPRSGDAWILVGACAALSVLVAAGAVVGRFAARDSSTSVPVQLTEPCYPEPCRPPPEGLSGIRLESTESEVRARTGPLTPLAPRKIRIPAVTRQTDQDSPGFDLAGRSAAEAASVVSIQEVRYGFKGAIESIETDCELAFTGGLAVPPAGELSLAAVECELIDPAAPGESDIDAFRTLRDHFAALHGPGERDGEAQGLRWVWKGERSGLALEDFWGWGRRRIVLSSFTPDYAAHRSAAYEIALRRFDAVLGERDAARPPEQSP
ncbi:MAG TPA: protein kinase, partial [Kofleriaceae bacterium]|nr:protein kinase [Kofleriaceae bacterium]